MGTGGGISVVVAVVFVWILGSWILVVMHLVVLLPLISVICLMRRDVVSL